MMGVSLNSSIFFFCLIVLTSGCKKNSDVSVDEYIFNELKSQDVDINGDQIMDFRIDYNRLVTDDYPSSGKSWIGFIQSLNKNAILYKPNYGNLFLQEKDTVFSVSTATRIWSPYPADLLTNSGKDAAWAILAPNTITDYYLGFKLSAQNQIGWMKVNIHKSTGMVTLVNKKLAGADFIVIEE